MLNINEKSKTQVDRDFTLCANEIEANMAKWQQMYAFYSAFQSADWTTLGYSAADAYALGVMVTALGNICNHYSGTALLDGNVPQHGVSVVAQPSY